MKTRDKIKCSQKISLGEQFSWGKVAPRKIAPHPPKKKKGKKKKIYLPCKM